METTYIKKIQNITKDSIKLFAFFEPKKGHGEELKNILLELVEPTRKSREIYRMFNTDQLKVLTNYYLTRFGLTKSSCRNASNNLTLNL